MQSPAIVIAHYLGIGELTFGLEPRQWRALQIISVLPALFLIATLTELVFEIEGESFGPFADNEWRRLYRLSVVMQTSAAYVGLAVMVIAGIGRITRSEGSFCFVGAIAFAGLALLSGIYASTVYTLIEQVGRDWHADIALKVASFAGLIAAGYGFLAFRGLAPRDGE